MAINVHVCCPLMVAREGATQRISVKKTPMKNSMKNTGFFLGTPKFGLFCVFYFTAVSQFTYRYFFIQMLKR